MSKDIQVSAIVSSDTKELLDRLVRATGLKKGYVLEMALRHHLQALQELPADLLVPPRLVLSLESGRRVLEKLQASGKPTRELRRLMTRDGH